MGVLCVRRKKSGSTRSIYLFASEVAFIETYDIDLQGVIHDVLDMMQRLDEGRAPERLMEEFEEGQQREREVFMSTLETYSVGRVVDQVKLLKRRRGITEVHRALEAVLGPPPWDALAYRERIKDYHLKTLHDIGVSQEELEGYSRVRGFLVDQQFDMGEYIPRLPEAKSSTANPEKERKVAYEKIKRNISNFVTKTPKKELGDMKRTLDGKDHIKRACEDAGTTLDELWDKLTINNKEVE